MVQVVPFKREAWKMWAGFYFEKLHVKTLNFLSSTWVDRYKSMFWNKKSFNSSKKDYIRRTFNVFLAFFTNCFNFF